MKFKDIKVGDTVFVEQTVKNGFSNEESFYIPKQVNKVTPTQFWIGDWHYFKESGKRVGVYGEHARLEGDKDGFIIISQVVVTDQTAEMEIFKQKVSKIDKISLKISALKLDKNTDKSLDELNEILVLIEQLENKLK